METFPEFSVPELYRELDTYPNPVPFFDSAYGIVRHLEVDMAIIEAEGTICPEANKWKLEDFDNYCVCHRHWTTVDGLVVKDLSDRLIVGDVVDFTFSIWKHRSPIQPLYCTVKNINRRPIVVYIKRPTSSIPTKCSKKAHRSCRPSRSSHSEFSDSDSPKKRGLSRFVINMNPLWTARQIRALSDCRLRFSDTLEGLPGDIVAAFVNSESEEEMEYPEEIEVQLSEKDPHWDNWKFPDPVEDLSHAAAMMSLEQNAANLQPTLERPPQNINAVENTSFENTGARPKIRPLDNDVEKSGNKSNAAPKKKSKKKKNHKKK